MLKEEHGDSCCHNTNCYRVSYSTIRNLVVASFLFCFLFFSHGGGIDVVVGVEGVKMGNMEW